MPLPDASVGPMPPSPPRSVAGCSLVGPSCWVWALEPPSLQGTSCERLPVPRPSCLGGDHAAWEGVEKGAGVHSVSAFFLCAFSCHRVGIPRTVEISGCLPGWGSPTCQHRARPFPGITE